MIMKSVIIAALVVLAILSEQTDLGIMTLSIALISLAFLIMVADIHSSYKSINIGNSIMENLKERLLFLEGTFNTFLTVSSIGSRSIYFIKLLVKSISPS